MVERIVKLLCQRDESVSVAESCTGGMVSSAIVSVSGASGCFGEGYVTYSNEAKEKNLEVRQDTLQKYGAVSEQTACQMAQGVRKRAGTHYGVATTGIAGPDGGTREKPVGLVYIACSSPRETKVIKCLFKGNRMEVRTQATDKALALLLECIRECEE